MAAAYPIPQKARGVLRVAVLAALTGCPGCPDSQDGVGPTCIVTAVSVLPSTAQVEVNGTTGLNANLTQTNCSTAPTVSWESLAPSIASVSPAGVVTGVAEGSATIKARAQGQSGPAQEGTAQVTVVRAPVDHIDVTPSPATVEVLKTVQLTAVPKDSRGAALTGRTLSWTSLTPNTVSVSASGLVQGVAVGSGTVQVTSEGKTTQVTVNVTAGSPASVTVVLNSSSLQVGQTTQATATVRDAANNVL